MNPHKVLSFVNSRQVSLLLLFIFYWMVATSSLSGFVGKWALRDSEATYGIEQILDNTAIRPFAYRILVPAASGMAERIVPDKIKAYAVDKLGPYRTFSRATSSAKENYAFRYVVIMYACLGFCLGSLFVLRSVLLNLGLATQTATFIPAVFIMAFPFIQTIGGYFYDYVELFFLAAAMLLAMHNKWLALLALTIPATLNKEAFFFFLPTLYPILRSNSSRNFSLSVLAAAIGISGVVNLIVKWQYLGAGGDAAHFQLIDNLQKYLSPKLYGQLEVTYGFVGPSGAFIGTIFTIVAIILRGWKFCPPAIRSHILIASSINLPLFMLFCAAGEMRNLSLLFVGFIVLIAYTVEKPNLTSRAPSRTRLPQHAIIEKTPL